MTDTIIDKGIQLGLWGNDKAVEVEGNCEVVQETLDDAKNIREVWNEMPPVSLTSKPNERKVGETK